jgi:hypothetical protein
MIFTSEHKHEDRVLSRGGLWRSPERPQHAGWEHPFDLVLSLSKDEGRMGDAIGAPDVSDTLEAGCGLHASTGPA